MTTRVALFGAGGRMGGVLAKMVIEADDLTLAGAYERSSHPDIGRDVGVISGLSVQKQVLSSLPDRIEADVVMDFSLPEGTAQLLRVLRGRPLPLICGTTGLSESIRDEVAMLAMRAPVVWSPNFSSVSICCFTWCAAPSRVWEAMWKWRWRKSTIETRKILRQARPCVWLKKRRWRSNPISIP